MTEVEQKVALSRRRFEDRLEELRSSLALEVGGAPRRPGWVLPIVFAAGGLALALGLRRRLKGRGRRALRRG